MAKWEDVRAQALAAGHLRPDRINTRRRRLDYRTTRHRLAAIAVALAPLLACGCNAGCGKGEHTEIVAWVPMTVGKVSTMQPIYACEGDR